MADTHDMIDGLLAEFRGYAAGMPPSYHVTMSWHDFRRMLDRLEAAHKRERGDAAKLREALIECAQYIACVGGVGVGEVTINDSVHLIPEELAQKAIAALSAPPRNCDVGTAQEQAERWYWRYHVGHLCQSCPLGPRKWSEVDAGTLCFSEWQQMPYEEGGAK